MLFLKDGNPWISLGNDNPEHHIAVVDSLVSEMDRRISKVLYESDRDNFAFATLDIPTIFVMMEEFPGTVASFADAKQKKHFLTQVRRLAQESAKAGFRLSLLAQKFLVEAGLDSATRSNLSVRVGLRAASSADAGLLFDNLAETVPESVIERIPTFSPGEGLISIADNPRLFRSYNMSDLDGFDDPYAWYLSEIRRLLTRASELPLPEGAKLRSLPLHFGVDQYGETVVWDAVKRAYHSAMSGVSRSGKTMACYNVLSQIASVFPLASVGGCDPSGLLLRPFAEFLESSEGVTIDA